MDRRMLAIGATAIALVAVGCGADAATERAIQVPDVEAGSAVTEQNRGHSGASDAAQGNSTQPQTRDSTLRKGVEQQRRYYEGTRPLHIP